MYITAGQDDPDWESKELRRFLYISPELLRNPSPPPRGTQKGDVYSFGIILYEILGRAGPWGHLSISLPGEIYVMIIFSNYILFRFWCILFSIKKIKFLLLCAFFLCIFFVIRIFELLCYGMIWFININRIFK